MSQPPSGGDQVIGDHVSSIVEDATLSPAPTTEYSYNAAGQLVSASVNSASAGAYGYDYLSRLTTRTTGSTTLHRVHDLDGNVIAEYDATGTLITEYVWLDGRPLAVIADAGSSPSLYYVLTDHLERPLMLADENRTIVWQATYLPFGEVATLTGSASLNLIGMPDGPSRFAYVRNSPLINPGKFHAHQRRFA